MKLHVTLTLCSISLSLALAACGRQASPSATLAAPPTPTQAAAQTAAQAGNTLGLSLLKQLATAEGGTGNLLLSPPGVTETLGMLAAGAKGTTATGLTTALGYPDDAAALAAGYGALATSFKAMVGTNLALEVGNRLWIQNGLTVLPALQTTLTTSYGAGVGQVDFQGAPADAVNQINAWVAYATSGTVTDLLAAAAPGTSLILTSAMHFKGVWTLPFSTKTTAPGSFLTAAGTTVTAPLMARSAEWAYTASTNFDLVELPYKDGTAVMDLIVPRMADRHGQAAPWLDDGFGAELSAAITALAPRQVSLTLPTFQTTTATSLAKGLAAAGASAAFASDADYSGITGSRDLALGDVIQKAVISVNETGTEAGAGTAGIMYGTAAGPEPVAVRADHPFAYAIRDTATGALLFIGILATPQS